MGCTSRSARRLLALPLVSGCIDYSVSDDDDQVPDQVVVEESFAQSAEPAVDVLWVIDDTASMAREQALLAEAFLAFAAALEHEAIAYQLGVITTDVSDAQAGVLQGLPWIVTPELDDPAAAFAEAVQVGTDGAAPEAGLGAAWLALTEPNRSGANRGFRRPGALLHVVVVSDADDDSAGVLGEDPGGTFLDLLEAEAQSSGLPPLFSAVAGDVPNGCTGLSGRAPPAPVYAALVESTGGVFASICEGDMEPVLRGLGVASLAYADTFLLQASPIPGTLAVWVDEERALEGWTWQAHPSALVFEEPPVPDASIRVRYAVDEEAT